MNYRELTRIHGPGDLGLVRLLLDAEGIAYYTQGEGFASLHLLLEPVRIMVASEDFDRAADLLADLDLEAEQDVAE